MRALPKTTWLRARSAQFSHRDSWGPQGGSGRRQRELRSQQEPLAVSSGCGSPLRQDTWAALDTFHAALLHRP